MSGPAKQWRATADQIHREVCEKAFDADRGTFTQAYGSKALDATIDLFMCLTVFYYADGREAWSPRFDLARPQICPILPS